MLFVLRSGESNLYTHSSVFALPFGRSGSMLHKSQSTSAVRYLDKRQKIIGALSNEGHCYNEQRIIVIYQS